MKGKSGIVEWCQVNNDLGGKDVKMIEESVFDSCDKLETVNILSEEIEIKRNSFDGKLIDLIFNGKRLQTNKISSKSVRYYYSCVW